MSSDSTLVTYEKRDSVACITLDDGKVNALSPTLIAQLESALDQAAEAKAVVLAGRPGRFSAGFDLRVMMSGPKAAADLVRAGARLLMRLYGLPQPLVVACTGHALAGGALLLATGDTRIGISGDFKIGLNEVQNGMPVPILAHELARDRLDPRELVASVLQARIYDPAGALRAGWMDRLVEPDELQSTAMTEAKKLAKLAGRAYAMTKASLRRQTIEHVNATLEDNLQALTRLN